MVEDLASFPSVESMPLFSVADIRGTTRPPKTVRLSSRLEPERYLQLEFSLCQMLMFSFSSVVAFAVWQIIFGILQFCETFLRSHFGDLCTEAPQRAAGLQTWKLGDRGHS